MTFQFRGRNKLKKFLNTMNIKKGTGGKEKRLTDPALCHKRQDMPLEQRIHQLLWSMGMSRPCTLR